MTTNEGKKRGFISCRRREKGGDAKVTKKVCGEHFYSGHFYTRLVFLKTQAAIVPKNKTVIVSG